MEAKGTDLIWTQICSSLLHVYPCGSHLPFPGFQNLNVKMKHNNNIVSKELSSSRIFSF